MNLDDRDYVTLRLAEVAFGCSALRRLRLADLARPVRTYLYNHLGTFRRLEELDMGAGTGGWLTETFLNRFYGGGLAARLGHLVIFRMHHDCTDHILDRVAQGSPALRIVDVQYSQFVSDSGTCLLIELKFQSKIRHLNYVLYTLN